MVYPIIKPPEHPGILFSFERTSSPCVAGNRQELDPNLHPLFGIPVTDTLPRTTEYEDAYCSNYNHHNHHSHHNLLDHHSHHNHHNHHNHHSHHSHHNLLDHHSHHNHHMDAHPPSCKPVVMRKDGGCHNTDPKDTPRRMKHRGVQAMNELYDPTPLPLIDKHFRRNYYRINDPVGVTTVEEVTKCRETVFGVERITTIDEIENTFTPNYRYKDWVQQPRTAIARQLDTPSTVCRLPEPDLRYWNLYNRDRMHRAIPKVSKSPYGTCRVVPIPHGSNMPNVPPVASEPHFGKFNNVGVH